MNKLDENLKLQIETMTNRTWNDSTLSADECIAIHKEAWELFPNDKLAYSESYDVLRWLAGTYLYLKDYSEAKKWAELFLQHKDRNYGEQEKILAKILYELGEKELALDYFVMANVKGGGLRWGDNDKHYKLFFTNAPEKDEKIKAYKQSLKPKKAVVAEGEILVSNLLTRKLYHDESEKVSYILREGKSVKEENGKPGKTKVSMKDFPDDDAAYAYAVKKELDLLRKGFVYRNEQALNGQPVMHYFLSRFYTGALAFENTPQGIYVSGVGKDNSGRGDYMDRIDERGVLHEKIILPRTLPWNMQYNPQTQLLYLYLDKCLYEYSPETGQMQTLTDPNPREFSNKSLAFSGDTLALTLKESIELTHHAKTASEGHFDLSFPRQLEYPVLALSADGKIMAMHNKPDVLELIDTQTGELITSLQINTTVIEDLQFILDDTMLVFRDMNNYWKLRFFNLENKLEVFFKELTDERPHEYLFGFTFNSDASKLALSYRHKIDLIDFKEKKKVFEFNLEHCHKKAQIKFVNELLGVRTDMGCFSLYRV